MDVREDGDAHRQSLAARSAGIGAGPRVARPSLAAPPGAAASPGLAGPGGRRRGYAAPVAPRFVATTRRWSGPAGRHAVDDPDPAAAEAPRPPAGRPRAPRPSRSPLPGDERSAPDEQRERQLDELRQRRRRPGRRPPASARAGEGPRRASSTRTGRDLDRRREAGRGHGRLEERRLLADRLDEQRPLRRQRGRERDAREAAAAAEVDERPDPELGEARGPRRGCR